MQYLGGKSRLAKQISQVILDETDLRKTYLEPFVGGGSVLSEMSKHFKISYASDICPDLIALWNAANNGWIPPMELSETEYLSLRDSDCSPLKGFAKYGVTFGGKAWGGYARQPQTGLNFAATSSRSICKQVAAFKNVTFTVCDFAQWTDLEDTIIYCDPPYQNTTGYGMKFNHDRFWNIMQSWHNQGAIVFISEKQAPKGWTPIIEFSRHRKVEATTGLISEYVFKHA